MAFILKLLATSVLSACLTMGLFLAWQEWGSDFFSDQVARGTFFPSPIPTTTVSVAPTTASVTPVPTPTPTAAPTPLPTPVATAALVRVLPPFTAQAPLNQWHNATFQDGCEEASILIAGFWVTGRPLPDPAQTSSLIAELAAVSVKTLGTARDQSAADTAQLLRDYFNYSAVTVAPDITVERIKQEVDYGNLVIVPTNGRALGNPYFIAPGPDRHMLVIHAYDPVTDEFITHDPGTQNGKNYRYPSPVLYQAIRDYPTGNHLPIHGIEKTAVIVERPS